MSDENPKTTPAAQQSEGDGFRRVHRLTPLLHFWSLILAILAVFLVQVNVELLGDIYTFFTDGHLGQALRGTAIALGGFVVVCLVIWLASGIWWRRLGFKLDDEEISLRRGVLSKSLRSARYDRTQAVDVVEDLIARIFGLASVRVETAGGTSSVIEIAYLKRPRQKNCGWKSSRTSTAWSMNQVNPRKHLMQSLAAALPSTQISFRRFPFAAPWLRPVCVSRRL